jgi:hypothetical protein
MAGMVNSFDYTRNVWERIPARPQMSAAAHIIWFLVGILSCGLGWVGWVGHVVVNDFDQKRWDRTYAQRWIQP